MKQETMLDIFRESGALLEGHFLLSSGLHSPHYMQCARIFEDPALAEKVVGELTKTFAATPVEWVVGPALGGVLMAYELGRQLKAKVAFTERADGTMTLRRGFSISAGSRIILAEDVLTTGGSVLETADVLLQKKVNIVGIAALVNRSSVKLPYPTHALLSLHLIASKPEECALCREGKPIVKPGSRTR